MLRKILGILAVVIVAAVVVGWLARVPFAHWRARSEINRDNLAVAETWLSRAEKWSPSNAATQFLLARVARKRADMAEFPNRLSRAMALGYSVELVQREQWLALAQQGQLDQVMPKLNMLLVDQRGDGREITSAFVQGFLKMRQFTGANDLLDAWIADHPDDPQPLLIRSSIHREFHRWGKAESDLRRALEIDPDHAESLLALGNVLVTRQVPAEAVELFRRAAKSPSARSEAVAGEVRALRLLGKMEEAKARIEQGLAEDPNNELLKAELARFESENGNYEKVIEIMRPLVQKFPRSAEYHYVLGTALISSGKRDEGRVHVERSQLLTSKLELARRMSEDIRPDASSVEDRYQVGMIHLEYGKESEGLIWLTSVLNLRPSHRPTLIALADYYKKKAAENPEYEKLASDFQSRIESPENSTERDSSDSRTVDAVR